MSKWSECKKCIKQGKDDEGRKCWSCTKILSKVIPSVVPVEKELDEEGQLVIPLASVSEKRISMVIR